MTVSESNKPFVGYEYQSVRTSREMEPLHVDGYQSFGWEFEDQPLPSYVHQSTLKFRRNRNIRNKAELTRLQRQFDSCVIEIEALKGSETLGASILAYTLGIIGAALLAGATFAFLAGAIPLMIALAIPGFVACVLPYFCFVGLKRKRAKSVAPLIEQKYDEIYDVCKKANSLLA